MGMNNTWKMVNNGNIIHGKWLIMVNNTYFWLVYNGKWLMIKQKTFTIINTNHG